MKSITLEEVFGIIIGTALSVAIILVHIYFCDKEQWEQTKRFFGGGYKKATWRDWMYWP